MDEGKRAKSFLESDENKKARSEEQAFLMLMPAIT
jgi:hypothetical protein